MAIAGTILFAPTVNEIGTTVHTWTIGKPTLSISFSIDAPHLVQVPQVDVIITPSTPSAKSSCAYSFEYLTEFATDVPFPTVE